jgi:hypothetical protein
MIIGALRMHAVVARVVDVRVFVEVERHADDARHDRVHTQRSDDHLRHDRRGFAEGSDRRADARAERFEPRVIDDRRIDHDAGRSRVEEKIVVFQSDVNADDAQAADDPRGQMNGRERGWKFDQ